MNNNKNLDSKLSVSQSAVEGELPNSDKPMLMGQREILTLKYRLFQCKLYLIEQSNTIDGENIELDDGKSTEYLRKSYRFLENLDRSEDIRDIEAFLVAEEKTNGSIEIIPTLSLPRPF